MVFDFFTPLAVLVNPVFSPLLLLKPHMALALFSLLLTAVIYAINKIVMNPKVTKEIKEKLATLKEGLAMAQKEGRKDDIKRILDEYMAVNSKYSKQIFKSLIISTIALFLFFPWAKTTFEGMIVVTHPVISFFQTVPLIKLIPNWIMWYILVSITTSWLLRKFIGE